MRGFVLLLAMAAVVGCGKKPEVAVVPGVDTRPRLGQPRTPLPDNVWEAWQSAETEAGWMDLRSAIGHPPGLVFADPNFHGPGTLPAFRLRGGGNGSRQIEDLWRLPAPTAPFGLWLSKMKFERGDLKQLSAFTNLTYLGLHKTQVTDDQLEELLEFPNLRALALHDSTLFSAKGFRKLAKHKKASPHSVCPITN